MPYDSNGKTLITKENPDIILRTFAREYKLIHGNTPMEWMNTDFIKTASYSDKLREVSKHYYTFNNGSLEFRTVSEEYLIAMKMVSAREYRNDMPVEERKDSYTRTREFELEIKHNLVEIDKNYPDLVTEQSVEVITNSLREKLQENQQ